MGTANRLVVAFEFELGLWFGHCNRHWEGGKEERGCLLNGTEIEIGSRSGHFDERQSKNRMDPMPSCTVAVEVEQSNPIEALAQQYGKKPDSRRFSRRPLIVQCSQLASASASAPGEVSRL
jgi:hypothetical protein